jgi:hypothetical protein
MKLSQIEVIVVRVKQLVCIFFVHARSTQPDAAVAALDRGLPHVEVAKG